jgi:DNA-binding beta-propeller fold protein YncE
VFELSAGGSSVTNLNLSKLWRPYGLAIDPKTGYLWEADLNSGVNIYNLASGTSPVQNIPGTGYSAISIQHEGKPPGEVVISSVYTSEVYAFKPGQYTAYATLSNGVEDPTGLLITKP